MMTRQDDDLLTALQAARPDPGYEPSAASPEARAMLAFIVQARHGGPRLASRWRLQPVPGSWRTGRAFTCRRRTAAIAAAAIAVGLAATLTLLPGNTSGASPTAIQLLAKVADAAAAQPSPAVRDSQFWYIKSWGAFQGCDVKPSGEDCVMGKAQQTQIWQSVSDLCITGLGRTDGHSTPLVFSSNYLRCPYRGGIHDPTYRFLQSLPTSPHALLSLIEQQMHGQLPPPDEAFTTIGDLLRGAIAPPEVSAALYRAAALIPGVTVLPDAADAIGRHGVAVAFTYQGTQTEWIFSKQTFQYLGEHDISLSTGATTGESAVLQRAFVDHVGQIPS